MRTENNEGDKENDTERQREIVTKDGGGGRQRREGGKDKRKTS